MTKTSLIGILLISLGAIVQIRRYGKWPVINQWRGSPLVLPLFSAA